MDEELPSDPRARRAIPLIAAALAVMIVLSLVYLRPASRSSGAVLRVPTVSSLDQRFWPTYDFVTPSLGWALVIVTGTSTALVYRTTDGAKSWHRQFSVTAPNLGGLAIHFFDKDHGIFYAGRLFRTSDGGAHWNVISLPDGTPSFSFASSTSGWAVDLAVPSRTVYATRDGGLTWNAVGTAPGLGFGAKGGSGFTDFRSDGEGWLGANAAEPTVYATFDGGASWRAIALPVPHVPVTNPIPGKPYLADYTTFARLLPGGGVAVEIDAPAGASAFISSDRGLSWEQIPLPPTPQTFGDVSFVDARHWWASRWSLLYKTSDAGRTWHSVHTVVPDYLGDWQFDPAHVIDAGHAWLTMRSPASGRGPTVTGLSMSADGGASWNPVNVPQPLPTL